MQEWRTSTSEGRWKRISARHLRTDVEADGGRWRWTGWGRSETRGRKRWSEDRLLGQTGRTCRQQRGGPQVSRRIAKITTHTWWPSMTFMGHSNVFQFSIHKNAMQRVKLSTEHKIIKNLYDLRTRGHWRTNLEKFTKKRKSITKSYNDIEYISKVLIGLRNYLWLFIHNGIFNTQHRAVSLRYVNFL